jgi:hypothetical protein
MEPNNFIYKFYRKLLDNKKLEELKHILLVKNTSISNYFYFSKKKLFLLI